MSIQDEFAAVFAARADEIETERLRALEAAEAKEARQTEFLNNLFTNLDETNAVNLGETE